jgi:hypothetical protein
MISDKMKENSCMIDLQQFCEKEGSGRPYLERPWSRGEYTYATNSHILVRVPRRADVPEDDAAPSKVESVVPSFDRPFVSMPKVEIPLFTPADEECEDCGGSGFEHDCPNCDCECDACDGSGKVTTSDESVVPIGHSIFAAPYIRQILMLPGLQVSLGSDPSEPMAFKFEGGIGVLMPRRPMPPAVATINLPDEVPF